jgi:hypothetical protein
MKISREGDGLQAIHKLLQICLALATEGALLPLPPLLREMFFDRAYPDFLPLITGEEDNQATRQSGDGHRLSGLPTMSVDP